MSNNRFLDYKYEDQLKIDGQIIATIRLKNNQLIKVQFIIYNSSEKYYQLRPERTYLRKCDRFILTYSINDKYSFNSLSKAIDNFHINKNDLNKKPIILIGTNLDENYREVSTEEAQLFANNNNLFAFYETSAKENINVNESLNALFEKICVQNSIFPTKEEIKLKNEKKNNKKVKKTCVK